MASLIIGSIIAAILAYGAGFFTYWVDALYDTFSNGTWQWMAMVCGLFGSLVALFHISNCIGGFSDIAYKIADTKRKSLVATFIFCILLFVDDWLNILIVGNAMKAVTDRNRIPREFLAYILASNAACICVLVPFSTWSAFFMGLYEANGVSPQGMGMEVYIETIPYFFFPLISLAICMLIILRILPVWGPMRKVIIRAEQGQVLSDEAMMQEKNSDAELGNERKRSSPLNFVLPLLVLATVTIMTKEMLFGVMSAILVCAVLYFSQRLLSFADFCAAMMNGFKDMLGVIGIVFAAFVLRLFNDALGLADYVIGLVSGNASASMLPAICFLIVSALAFAAGNFWGMAAITFPVMVPMGISAGADISLMASSLVCGITFGAAACFYGSEVVLACSSTKIANIDYAKTALPLVLAPFCLTVICFAIAGHIL